MALGYGQSAWAAVACLCMLGGCTKYPEDRGLREAAHCVDDCQFAVADPATPSGPMTLRMRVGEQQNAADLADTVASWSPDDASSASVGARLLDATLAFRVINQGELYEIYRLSKPELYVGYQISAGAVGAVWASGSRVEVAGDPRTLAVTLALIAMQLPTAGARANVELEKPRAEVAAAIGRLSRLDGNVAAVTIVPKPRLPAEKFWYTPNSSFTACIQSRGPAAKLDDLNDGITRARTSEARAPDGELTQVDVILDDTLQQHIWSYYRSRVACEEAEVNATKALADKYR